MDIYAKQKPEKILYLASTHWDREWYRTFQSFRFRLIEVIDEILDTLEQTPEFTQFMLDGHSVLLEDYLEIKPENRRRIETLLKEGRLAAGPWYTMPDEALCSGESLVNNLRLGFETVRGFGAKPMLLGYVCDMFGHIAQLPQILNGFGIDCAMLGRGTNQDETPAFFAWQSPDESRCLTFKVPEEFGYGSFYSEVIEPYKRGLDTSRENMLARAVRFVENELARSPIPYVILTDGMDHEPIHAEAVWLAERLGAEFDCQAEISSPERLLRELQSRLNELPKLKGELRKTARKMVEHNKLIPHTLSSRYDIKLANDICQNLLERMAGPMAAMAALAGNPVPNGYFPLINKMMAKNQAHDSICGCSIDDVSKDMLYRFRQVESICDEITFRALNTIAGIADYNCLSKEETKKCQLPLGSIDIKSRVADAGIFKLTVFNSEPESFSGTAQTYLDFPELYSARYGEYLNYEEHNMFRLYDFEGKEVPYQLLDIEKGLFTDRSGENYRIRRDRYHICFYMDIPAAGTAEYIIRPSETPVRNMGSMLKSDLCAENEHLILSVNSDGTIDIFQKATGRVFKNLLRFRDDAECGDGWFHAKPVNTSAVFSDGADAKIELLEDGSERCAFRITKYMRVSSGGALLEICSSVYLSGGARMVEVQTTVKNNAENHRLRLLLETGVTTPVYEADQAFAVISRDTGILSETHNWKEADRGDSSFNHLIMRRDGQGGIAFLSMGGMHECAVRNDERGSVEITLLRCFGKTFLTNGEPDGQLPGEWRFNYALLPLMPEDTNGFIMKTVNRMRSRLSVYTSAVPFGYKPIKSKSMFLLKSENIVLSTLTSAKREGFVILRLVNYGSKPETALVECGLQIAEAYCANLTEEELHPLEYKGSQLRITIGEYKIYTCLVRLQSIE